MMTYCSDSGWERPKGPTCPETLFSLQKALSRVLHDVVYKRNAHMNLGLATDFIETLYFFTTFSQLYF